MFKPDRKPVLRSSWGWAMIKEMSFGVKVGNLCFTPRAKKWTGFFPCVFLLLAVSGLRTWPWNFSVRSRLMIHGLCVPQTIAAA